MTRNRKLAYIALITTSLIWGFAPPIIKYTLSFVSPIVFLYFRFLFASLFFIIPLVLRLKRLKPKKKEIFQYLFLGFLGTPLSLLLLFLGLQKTTAIDSSIIGILTPILVIMGGTLFLKETVTLREKLGISLAVAGTVITIVQPILESGVTLMKNVQGNILVLVGTVVWASFTLLSKKQCRHLDPFTLSSSSFVLGFLLFTPLVFFEPNSAQVFNFKFLIQNTSALWGILYMAILGSVIAYSTYVYGVSKIEASEATVFAYLQPLFAIPTSVIFLKEEITTAFFLGAILIVSGVLICELRKK